MVENETSGELSREILVQTADVRVQIVTLAQGEAVPWHVHSVVTDSIVAIVGDLAIEMAEPPTRHRLAPGQRLAVPPGAAHRVAGADGKPCQFLNVHSGGAYDFRPVPDGGP